MDAFQDCSRQNLLMDVGVRGVGSEGEDPEQRRAVDRRALRVDGVGRRSVVGAPLLRLPTAQPLSCSRHCFTFPSAKAHLHLLSREE